MGCGCLCEGGVEAEGGAVVEDGDEGLSCGEGFGRRVAEEQGRFRHTVYGRIEGRACECVNGDMI